MLVLDNDHRLSIGSRALCFAKRTLEIWDRLGVGQQMVDKGVSWNVGRVFFKEGQVFEFNLLPEAGEGRPALRGLGGDGPQRQQTGGDRRDWRSDCGRWRLELDLRHGGDHSGSGGATLLDRVRV